MGMDPGRQSHLAVCPRGLAVPAGDLSPCPLEMERQEQKHE